MRKIFAGTVVAFVLYLVMLGQVAGAVAAESVAVRGASVIVTMRACPTEDSGDCYWDASRGNGQGYSFLATVPEGAQAPYADEEVTVTLLD